jgi:hypothetical protein
MPYGSGQRLGETINPQLMRADYSGFTNAAAVAGNTFANIGQQVGGAIKQYGEDEKTIKKSAQMAKSIRDAIPELAGMADNALAELSNSDLSQRDRLAIAESIQDSLKIGVMGLENNRSNAMLQLEAAKIAAAANAPKKVSKTTIGLGDGSEMDVLIDESGNMTDVFGNPIGGQGTQGAGASVQNALPQAQGGNFPDGIPTAADTPMPEVGNYPNYGSFDQATQGVAIDGAPRALPPRQPVANQPQYGVRSPKSKEKFRLATKEELAAYGAIAGQVEESSGKFYPINPPSGMEIKSDGKGGFTLIQGSGAGSKGQTPEQVAKTKAANERMFSSIYGSSVTVLDQIEKTLSDNPALAKIQGGIGKAFPASEEGQINAAIENIKIENSKAFIFDLKDRTGAVGQTTEREWPKYENRFGPIEIGMNPDQMLKTIRLNSLNSFEAVYGSPNDMKEKLDEGDINKSQYDSYVNDYLIAREELKIPDEGILGNKKDWSKLPEGLKSIRDNGSNANPLDVRPDIQNIFDKYK